MSRPARLPSVALSLVALIGGAWLLGALFFQFDPPLRGLLMAGAAAVAMAIVALAWTRRLAALLVLVACLAAAAVWWASILPSNDRDWAPDVAHGVTGTIDGTSVVLHHVRDFAWRTETDADIRWVTRRYDLDDLRSVDLLTSVWDNPAIAHTLLSFGFADGRHVVFSAEIRRKRHEAFSAIGGFFKRFELVLIAAEERDIVRLRTTIRREDVSLFPLRVPPDAARRLFRSYIDRANELATRPEFYQTVTTNCTTVVVRLAQEAGRGIPLDWRILLSGYLPDYLSDHGAIASDRPLDEIKASAKISPLARRETAGDDFSRLIRSGDLFVTATAR
ncbi:DUF4105 domain-containing protein [Enterovirga rhinocerotis]|uniref:Lnb N-terminal periplasmic domain-containing protein n=1 Tax=Enterovirga rhinocerotis TaxID=1339210 RepID=UPI001FE24280|nr:DUF4105 domain-containing protein [Enterovirga rhinocerotis]